MKLLLTALLGCALVVFLVTGHPASNLGHAAQDAFPTIPDTEITQLLTDIAANDVNGAQDGDVVVNYQNMASRKNFDHDNAPKPLFTSVGDALLAKPTFAALLNVQKAYASPKSNSVKDLTSRLQAAEDFFTAINATAVVQRAVAFLKQKGIEVSDAQIRSLWFTPNAGGVTAFQNVFAGSSENGAVTGLNNWVRFYTLEKAGEVNYHGWYQRQKGVQISLQFEWNGAKALEENFLLGTSPEFDISAFTVCALGAADANGQK
ncbi:Protein M60.2, partial [Aphelenchoides avenae]